MPPDRPRRIAFAGTPHDAVPALRTLAEAGFEIPVVVTGAARRRTRRGSDTLSPVAAAAEELGLPVSHDPADLAGCGADCAVVVAYGQLIGEDLLATTPMLNLHFSLLPRWRGAAPVERALLAGDDRTGVSLMALEATLDTGPVYWRHEVPIGPADTAAELRNRLAREGAQHLAGSLTGGLGTPQSQSGEPTYARKLTPADRQIDWSQPAAHIHRQIRVGGAWTTLDGERFIIRGATLQSGEAAASPGTLVDDAVATGDGLILLRTVQPAGRAALDAHDWLRGARLPPATRFG
ncbi:methionyl-tRNA formyltransferase [Candidatus Poriferisodalis sp.]|uniref:methionyl-tRNA formyltransferase n=1 Tax=Candidatus Poriferisodalis sp. TaxID=3101277 RepID=UPI003B5BF73A